MSSKSKIEVEFPATWVDQLIYAYEDFRANHDDLTCFSVWAYQEGNLIVVSFTPSVGVEVEDDEIHIPIAAASSCGRGAKYEFDMSGKFIRRIGIR